MKSNPYSHIFITAVKNQKRYTRRPLSLSRTQSHSMSKLPMFGTTSAGHNWNPVTPTDLAPPSTNFNSLLDDYHKLHGFYNPNKQHLLINEQYLNKMQRGMGINGTQITAKNFLSAVDGFTSNFFIAVKKPPWKCLTHSDGCHQQKFNIKFLLANSSDEQVDQRINPIVYHSRTVRMISTSTQRT